MPTTNADTPVQGTSLEDAAKVFEGLLDLGDTPDTDAPADDTAVDAAPAADGEGVAAEAQSQETPAAEETQEDEAEATDDAGQTQEADPKNTMVTVTIDGKSEVKPLEEVVKGYQRQADYSRKMDDLTTERRKLDSEKGAVLEERQTYATMLAALQSQLKSTQEEEPDWDEVFRTDPVGYARKRDEFRDRQEKLAAADFELRRVQSEQERQRAEDFKKIVADSRAKMLEKYPAWKDAKVWEVDRQKLVSYALSEGYSNEEISAAVDPRALIWGHKARLYDELMANKPKPAVAKGPKVASAGTAPASGVTQRLNAAQQRLAKSGRIQDAAKVFEQLL